MSLTATLPRLRRPLAGLAVAALLMPPVAYSHPGLPPTPHDLWSAWNLDPLLLAALLVASLLYWRGFGRASRKVIKRWQALCFAWAQLLLFVALVSPLDALGSSLLSAHMGQHLLLLAFVPPLLVLSAPGYVLLMGLPPRLRKRLARGWRGSGLHALWSGLEAALLSPMGALIISTGVVWAWHASAFYQATLTNEALHQLEHLMFVASAYLFWAVLLAPLGRHRTNSGVAVLLLFAGSVQGSALGALMTFAPTPWYPAYEATSAAWGVTALQDQQLAGLLMWMPIGTIYVAFAVVLLYLWLRRAGAPAVGARAGGD